MAHDQKGNLTQDEQGRTLSWDFENHLSTAPNALYGYDALGRRLFKTVNNKTTVYIQDGAQVLQEFEGSAFNSSDIGAVGLTGSTAIANGTFTITAAGTAMSGATDAFRYTSRTLDGNGSVTVKLDTPSQHCLWNACWSDVARWFSRQSIRIDALNDAGKNLMSF